GHRVTYFQLRDFEEAVRRAGLEYAPLAEREFPLGSTRELYAELGRRTGIAAMRYVVHWFTRETENTLRELPEVVTEAKLDLLLVDQAMPAASCVAEHLGTPFAIVSNALVINRDDAVPPFFTPWAYSTGALMRIRNRLAYAAFDRL